MTTTDTQTATGDESHRVAANELRQFVEREERLISERKDLTELSKDNFAAAKNQGYDPAVIKHCIKLRAADPDKQSEFEALLDMYKGALGMGGN